jgi:predicted RNase H-like nuclease (RuvC/YqgF family)
MTQAPEEPALPKLPPTREACRARIAELEDDVAAIKAQIATADLDRQQRRGSVDPRWFHRAKTALRHKQRQIAALQAQLPSLRPAKDTLKDCLIEVLRADYDDAGWTAALDKARQLSRRQECV